MNPDAPLYLTIASAASIGLFFAIRKVKKPEAKIIFPSICAALVLTIASTAVHASQNDFVFLQSGERMIDGLIPLLFGVGLLFSMVFTVAVIVYFIIRLSCIAVSARRNIK